MSDSLVIANSIELLQGDEGGQLSTLPMLGNTIFALNDQQAAYDLGAPQPTVDILASLITDGERPQGRRASNRARRPGTGSLPGSAPASGASAP